MKKKKPGSFVGYASVFNTLDLNNDIVFSGAFKSALSKMNHRGKKIPLLWSHHMHKTIGYCDTLIEDSYGLKLEGEVFLNTPLGKSLYHLMERKKLVGLSIGYIPRRIAYSKHQNVRCLKEVDLLEVSLVATPANPKARILECEPTNKIL